MFRLELSNPQACQYKQGIQEDQLQTFHLSVILHPFKAKILCAFLLLVTDISTS